MTWYEWYGPDHPPTLEEVEAYIRTDLWSRGRAALEGGFQTAPRLEYSRCSMQKGWNIKYKKGGRALCTMYPMEGYYLAMVVIGQREEEKIPVLLPLLSEPTQALYYRTPCPMGSRWLMMEIREEEALRDLLSLVKLRTEA